MSPVTKEEFGNICTEIKEGFKQLDKPDQVKVINEIENFYYEVEDMIKTLESK